MAQNTFFLINVWCALGENVYSSYYMEYSINVGLVELVDSVFSNYILTAFLPTSVNYLERDIEMYSYSFGFIHFFLTL